MGSRSSESPSVPMLWWRHMVRWWCHMMWRWCHMMWWMVPHMMWWWVRRTVVSLWGHLMMGIWGHSSGCSPRVSVRTVSRSHSWSHRWYSSVLRRHHQGCYIIGPSPWAPLMRRSALLSALVTRWHLMSALAGRWCVTTPVGISV